MIERKVVSQCISSDYCHGWNDAVDAMPRWISVEERLPETKLQVLVLAYDSIYCKGEIKRCLSVHVGYTRGEDEGWFDWHSGSWLDAAYWLPTDVLPEPPKEE